MNIVIIDDMPMNIKLLLIYFKKQHHTPFGFLNFNDSISCLTNNDIGTIFLDWHIPGEQTTESILSIEKLSNARIVILSGDTNIKTDKDICFKPYSLKSLLDYL